MIKKKKKNKFSRCTYVFFFVCFCRFEHLFSIFFRFLWQRKKQIFHRRSCRLLSAICNAFSSCSPHLHGERSQSLLCRRTAFRDTDGYSGNFLKVSTLRFLGHTEGMCRNKTRRVGYHRRRSTARLATRDTPQHRRDPLLSCSARDIAQKRFESDGCLLAAW